MLGQKLVRNLLPSFLQLSSFGKNESIFVQVNCHHDYTIYIVTSPTAKQKATFIAVIVLLGPSSSKLIPLVSDLSVSTLSLG